MPASAIPAAPQAGGVYRQVGDRRRGAGVEPRRDVPLLVMVNSAAGTGDVGDLTALHPRHRRPAQVGAAALAAIRVVDDRLVRVVDQRHRRPAAPGCLPGLRPEDVREEDRSGLR